MAETSKRTFSLPSDVAARLERETREGKNASAYVTDAVRARMRREEIAGLNAAAGIIVTTEGAAARRADRKRVDAEWPASRRKAVADQVHGAARADIEPQAPAA